MEQELIKIREKYNELNDKLSDPDITSNVDEYKKVLKEFSKIREIIEAADEWEKLKKEYAELKDILKGTDTELRDMAESEINDIENKLNEKELQLEDLMIVKDPMDEKDVIVEIRAGTGGDESTLFSADLFRMYSMYSEKNNWKVEVMESNSTGVGGYKEIIFSVKGKNVYKYMKYEKGVHRVQRIPVTESSGRIHTSAVTVAVLPEVENEDLEINPSDLKIDVYRSSGHGGQSVNTTDSAVRITHLPTGMVVTCQDERSQHKNKAIAMRVLRARLFEIMMDEKKKEIDADRKQQVGMGDRSERVRTYNFPQNRVTDHRINLTLYKLEIILNGELDEIINRFLELEKKSRLNNADNISVQKSA